jgi:phosphoribosylglycinamide formyltransferase-1
VAVLPGDDEARLHERIKHVERQLLVETVAHLGAAGSMSQQGTRKSDR